MEAKTKKIKMFNKKWDGHANDVPVRKQSFGTG